MQERNFLTFSSVIDILRIKPNLVPPNGVECPKALNHASVSFLFTRYIAADPCRLTAAFSLHCALFQAQGEGIGEHGDELGIRGFALIKQLEKSVNSGIVKSYGRKQLKHYYGERAGRKCLNLT